MEGSIDNVTTVTQGETISSCLSIITIHLHCFFFKLPNRKKATEIEKEIEAQILEFTPKIIISPLHNTFFSLLNTTFPFSLQLLSKLFLW